MTRSARQPRPDVRLIDVRQDSDWPEQTPEGIRRYLTGLVTLGPARLVGNAQGVTAQVLRVGTGVVPVLVSDGRRGKASILSPIGHHVLYPVVEISRRSLLARILVHVVALPLVVLFRAMQLDRIVLINHWLLSGAPDPDFPDADWPEVISTLRAAFPDHALVVPDIKPDLQPGLAAALMQSGGLAVPTRRVAILDPNASTAGGKFKRIRHARVILRRLVENARPDLLPQDVAAPQTERIATLYAVSNLTRHSWLNPDYRPEFFDLALTCREFHLHAWRAKGSDDDTIAAFSLQRTDPRWIHWTTFGRDATNDLAGKSGPRYYERVTGADFVMAEQSGLVLDWGAGADEFKRCRGSVLHQQVEVAFARHLGPIRRSAWLLLAKLRTMRARQMAGVPKATGKDSG